MGPSPNPLLHSRSVRAVWHTDLEITPVSNWGYWYEVGGKRLSGDNHVQVTWPDGHQEAAILRVSGEALRVNDMGHETSVGRDRLYLVVQRHGCEFATPWSPNSRTDMEWPRFVWQELVRP